MSMLEIECAIEFAKELAIKAGRIVKEGLGRNVVIMAKAQGRLGKIDLVTDVDSKVENFIISEISKAYPEHNILSEEAGRREGKGEYRWIIDPLDGTTNFIHNFPHFSISIALEEGDEIILGVVYDPVRNELFEALRGGGARLNGIEICTSKTTLLSKSLLAVGSPFKKEMQFKDVLRVLKNILEKVQAIRWCGSAALDLCYVGAGRLDGFLERNLKPWDTAAGLLIVNEALGKVTNFDGEPFVLSSNEIVASNGLIHDDILKLLS